VVVDEPTLRQANELALECTGIGASPTGTAGLAGLLQLQREGLMAPGVRVGVLFTGVQR
jgi:threonine synthase